MLRSQEYTLVCEYTIPYYHFNFDFVLTRFEPREALKKADPRPGGFQCAIDKESADLLFHGLTFDGKVVWARGE